MNTILLDNLLHRMKTTPGCPMVASAFYYNPLHMAGDWWTSIRFAPSAELVLRPLIVVGTLNFDFETALTAEIPGTRIHQLNRACLDDFGFKPLALICNRYSAAPQTYRLVCPTQGDAIMVHALYDEDFKP